MKLLRYGPPGHEKPGMLDSSGDIRDLSGVIPDLAGEALNAGVDRSAARARQLESWTSRWRCAHRAVRRRCRQVHLHRSQLLRPCRRVGHGGAGRADPVHEGDVGDLRAERRHSAPARIAENRLGSRARRGDRHNGAICVRSGSAIACCRLLRDKRSLGARVPARRHGAMGERQERRHVWPHRPLAGDERRSSAIRRISSCGSKSTAAPISEARPAT